MALPTELPKVTPQSWSDLRRFHCSARILAQFEAVGGWKRGEFPQCLRDGDLLPLLREVFDAARAHEAVLPDDAPVLFVGLWDLTDPDGLLPPHAHIEAYPGDIPGNECRLDRLVGKLRWRGAFRVAEIPPLWIIAEIDGARPYQPERDASWVAWEGRWAGPGEDAVWPAGRFGLDNE